MQTTPRKDIILRKGGAIAKPKPATTQKPQPTFRNQVFRNMEGKKFYLFPVMGSHVHP